VRAGSLLRIAAARGSIATARRRRVSTQVLVAGAVVQIGVDARIGFVGQVAAVRSGVGRVRVGTVTAASSYAARSTVLACYVDISTI
jgi:hypothetical protein